MLLIIHLLFNLGHSIIAILLFLCYNISTHFVCTFHPQPRLEVVCLATTPTHHVRHTDGTAVDIYIAVSLEQRLQSTSFITIRGARDSVCINFRAACTKKFGSGWAARHRYIEWNMLHIAKLAPSFAQPDEDTECTCPDSCVMCDNNDHTYCRRCSRTM